MRTKYYSPPIKRFLVCALYHQSKAKQVPMTRLINELVEAALKDSEGWKLAQEQMRLEEKPVPYRIQ